MEGARPAHAADLDTITALVEQAEAELRPLRGGDVWLAHRVSPVPVRAQLERELDDAAHLVLAGTIDAAVVGYARVRVEALGDGRVLGVIDDLYVDPGARQVGVGEALVDAALAWCRAQRCTGVDAVALPGLRETKNFFESAGFTARLLVMHRDLGR